LASGKRDYESGSGSGSSSIVVGASKQSAISFREKSGKVAVRTTTQVASAMIHLMAVGISFGVPHSVSIWL